MSDIQPYKIDFDLDQAIKSMEKWGVSVPFLRKIKLYVDAGHISISFDEVDFEANTWDGTLNVHIIKPLSTKQVVNLVGNAYADEVTAMCDTMISFWWD